MRKVLSSIGANWLGLASSAAVAFFLTPFILHRLGDSGYGLWLLVSTFTGYYGLLDFGLRSAILRYVARHSATKDWENLGRVLSTSLATYSMIACVILTLTLVTAWQFDMLFHLPPESTREAKLLLLVVGIGSALGVPVGVFAGFLEGFQEFVWINAVQMVSAGLRAVLIVFALNSGYGLVALGIITVGLNVGGSLVYALIAFKTCPRLRVRYTYVRMSTSCKRLLRRYCTGWRGTVLWRLSSYWKARRTCC